ncbi:MAG: hypothetical protein ACXWCO_00625 [Caldimonas sp.]
MTLAQIVATRRALNVATRYRLNLNATRPVPVYASPVERLAR